MRKSSLLLIALSLATGLGFAGPHKHEDPRKHEEHLRLDWERYRKYKEESLKIKEGQIAKEKECLQKAKDYWSYRECKALAKVEAQRKRFELRQRFMGGAQ